MKRCREFDKEKYLKTINKLSFDKSNANSLCPYKNEFLDFEEIIKIRNSKELPKAVDLLHIDERKKEVWFVEFKNRNKKNIDKYEIKRKILDSLISFYEILNKKELICEYKKKYFVVYKCSSNVFEEMYNEFEDRNIYFELEEIKNKFLDDVITECCEFFLDYFEKKFNIKWEV